jgi:phosphatidylserine/phosphatidylglycerophosphate/cardiolipin synthase-like enzyme
MALPLQPDLHPWLPWQRRSLILALLLLVILLLGFIMPARAKPALLIGSAAESEIAHYEDTARRVIRSAQQSLVVMLYVLRAEDDGPVARLMNDVVDAHKRGVQVIVLLDRGRDFVSGALDEKHQAAQQYFTRHGVQVVLDELERTTHAKCVIADKRLVLIGSHNWTRYALTYNREWSVLHDDAAMAKELLQRCARIPGWPAQF